MSISPLPPAGLGGALTNSLRGMKGAETRLEEAATTIAAAGLPPATAPEAEVGANLLAAQEAAPDLARAVVDTRIAQRSYEANLQVLRTADEITEEVLRLTR